MKWFLNFCSLAVIAALGYMAEPMLRTPLTGIERTAVELSANGNILLKLSDGTSVPLSSLTPAQLPKQVKLSTPAKLSDSASGLKMTIDAGAVVHVIRVENGNLVVAVQEGSPITGKIPVMNTDLLQQLSITPPSPATPKPEPAPAPEPQPEPEPAPAPEPESDPVEETPEPATPETVEPSEPEETPAPEPTPIPEPSGDTKLDIPGPATADGEDEAGQAIVAAMQASIKAGDIKEFTFDQVTDWTAGEPETIDGGTYETGLATYHAETIFGKKEIKAKALVRGGKVQRWIWPNSGMEIK